MIVDTHCHYDMMPNPIRYINDVERRGDIVIGMTNLPSHYQMGRSHIQSYRHVRMALGFHPLLATDNMHELKLFKELLNTTSYIGEIGLDFSREGYKTKDMQMRVLFQILSMLKGSTKIVSVHSRQAEKEVLSLLQRNSIKNAVFHWYTGSIGLMDEIISCGYYFSVNEAMTKSVNGRKL